MDEPVTVHHGDALAVLRELPDASVHAVITDPPYGLADHRPEVVTQALVAWASGDRERVPTGRGFMGRAWDAFVPPPAVWDEALRVLVPGGHLAVFAGSRTADLMGLSIRLAGFEMRDSIDVAGYAVTETSRMAWYVGSGFPKSLDVGKAIDKARNDRPDILHVTAFVRAARDRAGLRNADVDAALGVSAMCDHWCRASPLQAQVPTVEQWEQLRALLGFDDSMDAEVWRLNGRKGTPGEAWADREIVGRSGSGRRQASSWNPDGGASGVFRVNDDGHEVARATSDAAREWSGWGTSLKPAHEPILLCRKPLTGTVAQNVQQWRAGAINVDATRVGTDDDLHRAVGGGGGFRYGGFSSRAELEAAAERGEKCPNGRDAQNILETRAQWTPPDTAPSGRWPTNVVLVHSACEVYRLRSDVDPVIAAEITAHYRAVEAVRALRDGVPGDAGGTREAPVLQPGVCELGAPRGAGEGVGHGDLPVVPGDLRDHSGVGAERPPQVLREDLQGRGAEPVQATAREDAHRGVASQDGCEPADAPAQRSMGRREVHRQGRLPVYPDRPPSAGHADPGPSDDATGREVHPGASSCSREGEGLAAHSGRRSASRQRGEAGQPTREPDRSAASGSLDRASGDRTKVPHAAGGAGDSPGGERPLEVRAVDLRSEWREYFDYVGVVDACVDETGAPGPCAPGCQVAALDEQSGTLNRCASYSRSTDVASALYGAGAGETSTGTTAAGYGDTGGASKFFPTFRYQAKAPKSERPQVDGRGHPCVKPLGLMAWIVRLLTPPGGTVLDPFAGSGSTLQAARDEGMQAIGIEADEHSVRLIHERLSWAKPREPVDEPLTLFA